MGKYKLSGLNQVQLDTGSPWSGRSEYHEGKALGLDPDMDLRRACADFYTLEFLASYNVPGAQAELTRLEQRLAREFSIYISAAVGGELRHMNEGAVDTDYVYDNFEHEHSCTCDTCDTHWCEEGCDDATWDRDGNLIEVCDKEGEDDCYGCIYCSGNGCECDVCFSCGDPECHCCGAVWYGEWNSSSNDVPEVVRPFFETASGSKRHAAWVAWAEFQEKRGPSVLLEATRLFNDDDRWACGYGGEMWGTCAKVVYDYLKGSVSRRLFIDRAWTLQHNGGAVFDKLYDVRWLQEVLNMQAENKYDVLVSQFCTGKVKGLWHQRAQAVREGFDPVWLGR